jgi:hypothetical protein
MAVDVKLNMMRLSHSSIGESSIRDRPHALLPSVRVLMNVVAQHVLTEKHGMQSVDCFISSASNKDLVVLNDRLRAAQTDPGARDEVIP